MSDSEFRQFLTIYFLLGAMFSLYLAQKIWKSGRKALAVISFICIYIWPVTFIIWYILDIKNDNRNYMIVLNDSHMPCDCAAVIADREENNLYQITVQCPLPWRVCKIYALSDKEYGEMLLVRINKVYSVLHSEGKNHYSDEWGNQYVMRKFNRLEIFHMASMDEFIGDVPRKGSV